MSQRDCGWIQLYAAQPGAMPTCTSRPFRLAEAVSCRSWCAWTASSSHRRRAGGLPGSQVDGLPPFRLIRCSIPSFDRSQSGDGRPGGVHGGALPGSPADRWTLDRASRGSPPSSRRSGRQRRPDPGTYRLRRRRSRRRRAGFGARYLEDTIDVIARLAGIGRGAGHRLVSAVSAGRRPRAPAGAAGSSPGEGADRGRHRRAGPATCTACRRDIPIPVRTVIAGRLDARSRKESLVPHAARRPSTTPPLSFLDPGNRPGGAGDRTDPVVAIPARLRRTCCDVGTGSGTPWCEERRDER